MAETTVPVKSEEKGLAPTQEESRYLVPPVDIYETTDALVVVADVPGATKETIEVDVEDKILTIKAQPSYQTRGESFAEEFGLVNFFRQFQLSDTVNSEKIEAQYRHGVLTLTLPKAEAAKPKQITVSVN